MTREIKLTQGKAALVDDDMYDYINQWKWYFDGKYARRGIRRRPKYRTVFIHQEVAKIKYGVIPIGYVADHIDGNTLDCTSNNIRIGTWKENTQNRRALSNNTTGYRGVSLDKRSGRWTATIQSEDISNQYLGRFNTAEEAARAYDSKARELFGEFATLNFPNENNTVFFTEDHRRKITKQDVEDIMNSTKKTRVLAKLYNLSEIYVRQLKLRGKRRNIKKG